MLLQLLQTMQTDLVNPDKIIDLSSRVSETSGGYTFAVSLLMFVILILLVVVRSLWKKMTEQDNRYITLAESSTKLITEVNVKLESNTEIKYKLERAIEMLQEIKSKD